jgi:hypothetical protein
MVSALTSAVVQTDGTERALGVRGRKEQLILWSTRPRMRRQLDAGERRRGEVARLASGRASRASLRHRKISRQISATTSAARARSRPSESLSFDGLTGLSPVTLRVVKLRAAAHFWA